MTKKLQSFLLGFFLFLAGIAGAAEIHDLSTTDASNTGRFPEGMAPSAVNDAARALEGLMARGLRDTVDGYVLTGGTASALTVAAIRTLTSYYDGLTQTVEWHTTPASGATISLDSIGAKSLVWPNGSSVQTNELISGARAIIQYNSTFDKFQVLTLQAPTAFATGGISGQLGQFTGNSSLTTSGITSSSLQLVGRRTIWVPAGAMLGRSSTGAAISKAELATNKVMLNTLAFDGATNEFAQFTIGAPKSWNQSTVTTQFDWTADGGSGTVQWNAQCLSVGDGDAMDAAFGSSQGITDTFLASHQEHLSGETPAITCSGSNSQNDMLIFQVFRNAAADTHAADAHLLGVRIYMTTNAQTDQ